LKALQENYEMRLRELEGRRKASEGAAQETAAPAAAAPQPVSPAGPAPALRASAAAPGRTNFNPDLSLVLQGRYLRSRDIEERRITGFIPGAHEHGGGRGFNLDHTEFIVSGNVDPISGA
jgi:hypothetical protein